MEGLKYMRIQLQRCATLSVLGASNALVDAVFVTFGTHERMDPSSACGQKRKSKANTLIILPC